LNIAVYEINSAVKPWRRSIFYTALRNRN